jgi:hypothetical protein
LDFSTGFPEFDGGIIENAEGMVMALRKPQDTACCFKKKKDSERLYDM